MPKIILFVLTAFAATAANAQKLPNIQKESVRAPANIKIDGKATEWDNKFKAQNSATDLLYTLSNDDENLYLTVQTKLKDVMDKLVRGGITLDVHSSTDKKSEPQVSVTYPSIPYDDVSRTANLMVRVLYPEANAGREPITWDDFTKTFAARAKIIKVSGIKSATNGELSIYNDSGIQVASNFDDLNGYTYELALPLKYMALPNNGANAFSYQVKVNKQEIKPYSGEGKLPPPVTLNTTATTDFWGEYTLAKK